MGSNKNKKVHQKKQPKPGKTPYSANPSKSKTPSNFYNPDSYYHLSPSWNFKTADTKSWAFTKENIGEDIWDEIIPKLVSFESQTWSDILVKSKKQNHSIDTEKLNKIAQQRLFEKCIEAEAVISLRLSGNHRIYGTIVDSVFNILWYDDDHGDNTTCVCRSAKRHT